MGYGALKRLRKAALALALTFCAFGAQAGPVTVAALGDSLTQGYGLAPEAGFVAQLGAWLDAAGAEVTLINAGVSGDTTAGGAARVGWTLTPEVDALIVALGANDALRGIDPAVARGNLDMILAAAAAAQVPVLLVGISAPGNFGPDYKREFEAIYPALAAQYDTLYFENFVAGLGDATADPAALSGLLQGDGLHPNARGVALIVDRMGPAVLELVAAVGD